MAPKLAALQYDRINDMLLSRSYESTNMAAVGCIDRSIHSLNLAQRTRFRAKAGDIRPVVLLVLEENLLAKFGMYLNETIVLLQDEINILVNYSAVSRALITFIG
jgi:hypothetical protein